MRLRDLFKYKIFTVSNILTLARTALVMPLSIYMADSTDDNNLEVLIVVGAIITTDFFDGFLARKLGQETPLGQYLDPVADKIVTLTGVWLLFKYRDFPLWLVVFIYLREAAGTIGGAFLLFKRNILGSPNYWGKFGVAAFAFSAIAYIIRMPGREYTAYLVAAVFTGGIVAYAKTYGRTVFFRE